MPRAILLASATATTGTGLRSSIRANHDPFGAPRREAQRITAVAPMTSNRRMSRCPIGGRWRSVEVRACPVTFRPDSHQINAVRRDYGTWWHALGWVRDGLVGGDMLREVAVTALMPKVRPWEAR